jgi:hypothetical protein
MERAFKIGCNIIFFDSHRVAHEALVTNWFHGGPDGQTVAEQAKLAKDKGQTSPVWMPCCNLVYVTEDLEKKDPYGRQMERSTSTSYGRNHQVPFIGMCWAWPDEAEEAKALAAVSFDAAVTR